MPGYPPMVAHFVTTHISRSIILPSQHTTSCIAKGLSAFWSRRALLYSLIPPPIRNTVFSGHLPAPSPCPLYILTDKVLPVLHAPRTPGAAHQQAQPLSISNSFGVALLVAILKPTCFCLAFHSALLL